jgi:hypothetical protein
VKKCEENLSPFRDCNVWLSNILKLYKQELFAIGLQKVTIFTVAIR